MQPEQLKRVKLVKVEISNGSGISEPFIYNVIKLVGRVPSPVIPTHPLHLKSSKIDKLDISNVPVISVSFICNVIKLVGRLLMLVTGLFDRTKKSN